ncbi:LacI family DNA-binding transcriptional regulator [Nonomuraea roseoviolacea subsp. roseoviolacea]|uniref:LacI family transcriptional regulator n=1 Tax=Nonomuraea roseoviolacea subsp. carminata TaxID=160689 RepID=A0ABT1KAK2_9ACTN|nr:LacI family DNA-binding transcriptional regulator [Nonomuraea roseoviolacea]MCP2351030.1 LacI family transcriptional regulator [Nonomuraea roseoviolacea subsp. carminata]
MTSPPRRPRAVSSVPTVGDVAARAGVSRATVSYTFTQPDRVSPDLRRRVLAAADELGYVGNDAARRLRAGHSLALGLLVSSAANPVYAEISAGAEAEAAAHGRFVLLANSDESAERERAYLNFFESQHVSGIIAAPVGDVPAELLGLRSRGTPFVLVGVAPGPHSYPAISGDNERGGHLAAAHLLAQGRRRLLFAGGPHPHVDLRLAGVRRAIAESGVPASLEVVRVRVQTAKVGEEVSRTLLERPERDFPDGIVAGNDLLALGLLHGLIVAGVRVPEDLSLVGYDDIEFADFAIVPLTSVRHPSAALGAGAVRLLLGLEDEQDMQGRFEPELVVRATSLPTARP